MFKWRKRNDGFEWRDYVRTTVLVRRADRQKRIEDVRVAAVQKVKETGQRGADAGKAGLEGLGSAASRAGGVIGGAAASGSVTAARGMSHGAKAIAYAVRASAAWVWNGVVWCLRAAFDALPQRRSIVSGLRGAWSRVTRHISQRSRLQGYAPKGGFRVPQFLAARQMTWRPRTSHLAAAGGIFVAALALSFFDISKFAGSGGLTTGSISRAASARQTPDLSGDFIGRASAVSGDVIRVGATTVRLAGIEAPDPGQSCKRDNDRSWPCGQAAAAALKRLVSGRRVACDQSGTDDRGVPLATCHVNGRDVAAELVRQGHVFAQSGIFSSYGAQQSEAEKTKSGLWRGSAERPSEWRDRVWDEAKRASPDGCPIKGHVRASGLVYSLPWSKGYDRADVRIAIGERWFCSEADAKAAGWKLSTG